MATTVLTWASETRLALLVKLFGDGLSAAQIAAELGSDITRNAVIGKINRLGLTRDRPIIIPRAPRSPRVPKTRNGEHHARFKIISGNGNSNHLKIIQSSAAEMPALRCIEVVPRNLTLQELELNDCRYIAGDAYLYCAHPAKPGSAYCAPHKALMFIPPHANSRQQRKYFGTDFAKRSVQA